MAFLDHVGNVGNESVSGEKFLTFSMLFQVFKMAKDKI